jgi:3-phenylpropionate/trans-cinnamate dioxygenase ferredoxin component
MGWIDAGNPGEIAEGSAKSIIGRTCVIAVARCGGRFYAVEDICTHDGEALTGGEIEDCQIVCPRHGARFNLATGEALTPPAYENVRVFETKLEGGRLWVLAD